MKKEGFNVELVTEYAKDCVYNKQFDLLKNDQLFVLANQNRRIQSIIESNENVEYIITDSPLLLSKIYAEENGYEKNFISFSEFCVDLFASYENINIVLNRDGIVYDPNGRIQNCIRAQELDTKILKELQFWKFPYTLIVDRNISKHFLENINILNV